VILRRLLSALRDNRGVAAIEFGLMLPFLFVLEVGTAEFMQALQAQRRLAHLAAATADITAQSRTVSTADLTDIMNAGRSMIYPFGTISLGQRISSVSANASGSISVDWSVSQNYTAGGTASVPSGYLLANESVIVTDVIYDYHPTFGLFLPQTLRFTRHAYVRPRLSTKVEKTV
jgi:Flp pilus assembly protein TadG